MFKKDKQRLFAEDESVSGQEIPVDNTQDSDSAWMNEDNDGQLLLDVYHDKENIYIKSTIAGVKPEDLEISLNNDMLTIRGVRKQTDEVEEKDYFYKECYWGGFSRSIILPTEVKSDKISATLKDGVLTITLPKLERQRTIPIAIK